MMVKSSSRVAVAAPMSFAGSAARTMNLLWHDRPTALKATTSWWAVPAIVFVWWSAIVIWYAAFGLLLVPYRLLRRGSRKRKREARMHRETLDAIRDANGQPRP